MSDLVGDLIGDPRYDLHRNYMQSCIDYRDTRKHTLSLRANNYCDDMQNAPFVAAHKRTKEHNIMYVLAHGAGTVLVNEEDESRPDIAAAIKQLEDFSGNVVYITCLMDLSKKCLKSMFDPDPHTGGYTPKAKKAIVFDQIVFTLGPDVVFCDSGEHFWKANIASSAKKMKHSTAPTNAEEAKMFCNTLFHQWLLQNPIQCVPDPETRCQLIPYQYLHDVFDEDKLFTKMAGDKLVHQIKYNEMANIKECLILFRPFTLVQHEQKHDEYSVLPQFRHQCLNALRESIGQHTN
eukprot:4101_1